MYKILLSLFLVLSIGCTEAGKSGPSEQQAMAAFSSSFATISLASTSVINEGLDNGTIENPNGEGSITFSYSHVGDTTTIEMVFDNVSTIGSSESLSGAVTYIFTTTDDGENTLTTGSMSGSFSISGGQVSSIVFDYTIEMLITATTATTTTQGSILVDGNSFSLDETTVIDL